MTQPPHRSNFYVQLSYDEYKHLENQLRNWESIETSHATVEGFYHKALRIEIGTTLFEFQGPLVKAPITELNKAQRILLEQSRCPECGEVLIGKPRGCPQHGFFEETLS